MTLANNRGGWKGGADGRTHNPNKYLTKQNTVATNTNSRRAGAGSYAVSGERER